MTTETASVDYYRAQSRRYLAQASEELARGDLQQASEKGWGAAASIVKAMAERQGWRHNTHRDLQLGVSRVAEDNRTPPLWAQFDRAQGLHANFYEGGMARDWVEDALAQVAEFVARMEQTLDRA